MAQESGLAHTPEAISELRSKVFLAGANEIARIDTTNHRDLNRGPIGVALDAVHAALGKSERDFSRADARLISLLSEAYKDTFDVKIRSASHLFNEIKRSVCTENEIYSKKACDRDRIERFLRRIAAKLVNGHAGVWI